MKPYVVAEHEHDPAEEGEIVSEQGREHVPNRLVRSAHTHRIAPGFPQPCRVPFFVVKTPESFYGFVPVSCGFSPFYFPHFFSPI